MQERDDVDKSGQSDSDVQLQSQALVSRRDRGQWVATTYRRLAHKSGSCAVCGFPYVFCRCADRDTPTHMEGGSAAIGSYRDDQYMLDVPWPGYKLRYNEDLAGGEDYMPLLIRNVSCSRGE